MPSFVTPSVRFAISLPKFFAIVVCVRGILDDVVQQAGDDRRRIHAELDELACHGDRMDDIRLAGLAHLVLMRVKRKFVALFDESQIVLFPA